MNKNLKGIAILSHFHPQFHHILQAHTHTLKLTRWLPRHTTRRLHSTTLRATSEGSMTKVGLAIADKSVLKGGGDLGALPETGALRQILGLATLRPRGL
jgi:hypothetical protein